MRAIIKLSVGIQVSEKCCRLFDICYAEKLTDRDKFMSAEEAKEFGMVDQVLAHHSPLSDTPTDTS